MEGRGRVGGVRRISRCSEKAKREKKPKLNQNATPPHVSARIVVFEIVPRVGVKAD